MGKGIVDELKKEFDIEDQWLPLEIHPETPKEGMDLLKKFPKERLALMQSHIGNYGKEFNQQYNNLSVLSNSHLALQAAEFAKDKGKFQEFHEKLFHSYFTEGKDIGKLEVIFEITTNLGLEVSELKADLDAGKYEHVLIETQAMAEANDIHSTPTFIINDSVVITGAQPVQSFRQALIKMQS